jgi:hypothetical protein
VTKSYIQKEVGKNIVTTVLGMRDILVRIREAQKHADCGSGSPTLPYKFIFSNFPSTFVTKVTCKKRSGKISGSRPYKFIFTFSIFFTLFADMSPEIGSLFRPYATIPFAESLLELDLILLANVSAHDAQVCVYSI